VAVVDDDDHACGYAASVRYREHPSFEPVGVFDEYAEKHGRRLSSLWMQRGRSSEPRRAPAV
jgi:L-amino acid N-acyltransferase YncA